MSEPPANAISYRTGTFEINAKNFFITIPQSGETTKEQVQTVLKSFTHYKSSIIAKELHQDGSPHIHVLVIFSRPIHIRSSTYFDRLANKHANIGSVRRFKACVTYAKKARDFITDNWEEDTTTSSNSRPTNEVYNLIAAATTKQEAMDILFRESPRDYFIYGSQVDTNLSRKFGHSVPQYTPHASFNQPYVLPQLIKDWLKDYFRPTGLPRRKCLILVGKTQLGKTAWARSLGHHIFWRTQYNLDKWDNSAKYIVFDDIHWKELLKYNKQLLLAMGECTVTDRYRHKTDIVNYKPAIWCCNQKPFFGDDEEYWLENSVIVEIDEPLFSNEPIDDYDDSTPYSTPPQANTHDQLLLLTWK